MDVDATHRRTVITIGTVRVAVSAFVVVLLVLTYVERIAVGDGNPFD